MTRERYFRPVLESLESRTLPAAPGLLSNLGSPPANVSAQDQTFLIQAAQGSEQEIFLGLLAIQNGANVGVKGFGFTLVTDHLQSLFQEIPILIQDRIPFFTVLPNSQTTSTVFQFSTLRGSAFDTPFVNLMVQDHQQDITAAQFEQTHGTNPAAIGYATQILPVLEKHLSIAQSLQQTLG